MPDPEREPLAERHGEAVPAARRGDDRPERDAVGEPRAFWDVPDVPARGGPGGAASGPPGTFLLLLFYGPVTLGISVICTDGNREEIMRSITAVQHQHGYDLVVRLAACMSHVVLFFW